MRLGFCVAALAAFGAVGAIASPAQAVFLPAGTYRLHNHPDGTAVPPPYGARFDELFNASGDHDIFTLDFDHVSSAVFLDLNATKTQIHIYGQAYGGRDSGAGYFGDAYLGIYLLDFTYTLGVGPAGSDDDIDVDAANHANSGTITAPGGTVINLVDERDNGFSFRFGDEDNDLGHRGFNGISGWGWMSYDNNGVITHVDNTDWLFTATYEIPAPASAALLGLAGLVGLRRRR